MTVLTNKDRIRQLLNGIETGDPESVRVVKEDVYIQHNPHTHEGSIGNLGDEQISDRMEEVIKGFKI